MSKASLSTFFDKLSASTISDAECVKAASLPVRSHHLYNLLCVINRTISQEVYLSRKFDIYWVCVNILQGFQDLCTSHHGIKGLHFFHSMRKSFLAVEDTSREELDEVRAERVDVKFGS